MFTTSRVIRLCLLLLVVQLSPALHAAPASNEILWDRYGVPHIYGRDTRGRVLWLWLGAGPEPCGSHPAPVWRSARPRRRILGRRLRSHHAVDADQRCARNAHASGIASRTRTFRRYLDAFAQGINDYARAHPEAIDPAVRQVLPVSGIDVVAHAHRLMNFVYVASSRARRWARVIRRIWRAGLQLLGRDAARRPPTATRCCCRTRTWPGRRITSSTTKRISSRPGFEIYGATQIGLPVVRFAFNQRMGISNTVNGMLGATTYQLTLQDGGYLFDGERAPVPATNAPATRCGSPMARMLKKPLEIRSTVHGPVSSALTAPPSPCAWPGLDRPGMLQQYFDMVTPKSFEAYTRGDCGACRCPPSTSSMPTGKGMSTTASMACRPAAAKATSRSGRGWCPATVRATCGPTSTASMNCRVSPIRRAASCRTPTTRPGWPAGRRP